MKFKAGDIVRIKTIAEHEANGNFVSADSAIALWQNRMCFVEKVVGNYGYRLLFADPSQNNELWENTRTVNDFIWREDNLDSDCAEELDKTIATTEFEKMIGEN